MPHTFGHHRRSRSGTYFSGFTRLTAQLQGRKARSTEKLNEAQLDTKKRARSFRDLSKEASYWEGLEACKEQIEQDLELQVQTLLRNKRKYREVTVPTSIKFSITREVPRLQIESPVDMARSPTGSRAADTDFLDETLLNIRKKLNALSNDRLEMEHKMQELINGIQTINAQCRNNQSKSQHSFPQLQTDLYSSIRRVRSSATASMRPSNLNITEDKNTENLQQELDNPNLSQDSLSPQNDVPTRQRSSSAVVRHKPSKPSPISIHNAVSCGNIEQKTWLPATPINELPESPTFVLSNSSPSLQSYSVHGTAPRSGYRRSCSVSSPPTSATDTQRSPTMLTSTPNIPNSYETEHYHTLPSTSVHKQSLSESVITSIPEDEVDYASITDSLSQLSSCTDEGSPKNGSTIVARRSSLTGQIEHYHKPRLLTKKNSQPKELLTRKNSQPQELIMSKNLYPKELLAKKNSEPNDLYKEAAAKRPSLSQSAPKPSPSGKDAGYKVLNRGRKSRRYTHKIVLPGIETTV